MVVNVTDPIRELIGLTGGGVPPGAADIPLVSSDGTHGAWTQPTITDTAVPVADQNGLSALLSNLANRLVAITGVAGWKSSPALSIAGLITSIATKVAKAGDTMTGALTISNGSITSLTTSGRAIFGARIDVGDDGSNTSIVTSADILSTRNLGALAANITNAMTSGSVATGAVSGSTGTFSAGVSGTTGTFSGGVSGASASVTGALSGASAGISGNITAGTGTFTTSADATVLKQAGTAIASIFSALGHTHGYVTRASGSYTGNGSSTQTIALGISAVVLHGVEITDTNNCASFVAVSGKTVATVKNLGSVTLVPDNTVGISGTNFVAGLAAATNTSGKTYQWVAYT